MVFGLLTFIHQCLAGKNGDLSGREAIAQMSFHCMSNKRTVFKGEQIQISYSEDRCIRAQQCEIRRSAVFDRGEDPWIDPNGSNPDEIAETIRFCPSGALKYRRLDGEPQEKPPRETTCKVRPNGPYELRGDIRLYGENEQLLGRETRLLLCRCGQSKSKPYCDNSHRKTGFRDDANSTEYNQAIRPNFSTHVQIHCQPDGPYEFRGTLTVLNPRQQWTVREEGKLCRCGQSKRKPFCDDSHKFAFFRSANDRGDD